MGEADAGIARHLTVTGGVDLFPPGAAIPAVDYTDAMDECGVPYEVLETAQTARRWPQLLLPDGTLTLYQARTGIAPAARGVAAMQRCAAAAGAGVWACGTGSAFGVSIPRPLATLQEIARWRQSCS